MKQSYGKKYLTISVILLFIGLAFAPSIHANVSKGTVEFTTEVCGLDGGKHTVKLTQDEGDEVVELFKSIRERLNETETREEAEEIFKEAVVELDKYGLLGGLSVKHAQRLVIGGYQKSRIMRFLERKLTKHNSISNNESNSNCLIAGCTNKTGIFPGLFPLWMFLFPFEKLLLLLIKFAQIRPFYLSPPGIFILKFGTLIEIVEGTGWVYTISMNGVKSWSSTLIGRYEEANKWAVICFSGLNILLDYKGLAKHFWYLRHFYLGFAQQVIIEELD